MSARSGIAIVISDLHGGGAQQVVRLLAAHWAGQGHRVAVVTLSQPEAGELELDRRVQRISIGGIGGTSGLVAKVTANAGRVFRLRRALRSLQGATAIGFIGPTNVLLVLASVALGYRLIISERNDPARQSFGLIWDWLRRQLYRCADLVTANSRGAIETLAAYVPRHKLLYLPNPVRRPTAGRPDQRRPVFLNVGRLHRQKGQDLLIEAFALVAQELKDWQLLILGEGPARSALAQRIDQLGLGTRVELAGRSDPFPWYEAAGVFVFSSRHEGMPNALLEAMLAGLPVVVSDSTAGHRELVLDGVDGFVVDAENPEALSYAMKRLALDDTLRRRMGAAAAAKAEQYCGQGAFARWDTAVWPGGGFGSLQPSQ